MATIEPRLIHLLNESTTPQLPHTDLPPLHSLPLHTASDRSLPPLDRDAVFRERLGNNEGQAGGVLVSSLHSGGEEGISDHRTGKHAGNSTAFPLRLLLGETEAVESPNSLNKILDDGPDTPDDGSNKKRHRGLHVKDDFVQLPQPLKKQKATQQAPVMPPIINGLHEPPPHAALFPPISSTSFDGKDGGAHMKSLHELNSSSSSTGNGNGNTNGNGNGNGANIGPSEVDKNAGKSRKRAAKPRRKWSEEETNHLLLGVNRHGVGKWTTILEDADFRFNDRTAGDLKDRFRTCCPDELRKSSKSHDSSSHGRSKQKNRADSHLGKILADGDTPSKDKSSSSHGEAEGSSKQKKSRAHRKKMEDLVELGIHGPFKKSHRRERRPFTEQDDREILDGLNMHGPAWTKIQRDTRFNLSSRQPTDLRDRVRNKYPNIYQRIEKGTFQVKEGARSNDIMEPSINMSIDNSLKPSKTALEPHMGSSRDDPPRWLSQRGESGDGSHSVQPFEFGEASAPQFMGGEMDIARLLLDDDKMSPGSTRLVTEGPAGSASSPVAAPEPKHREHHSSHRKGKERSHRLGR